jgi:hypothetical protein
MDQEYKGYVIYPAKGDPRNLAIKSTKVGGSLPLKLSGTYTDRRTAREAIDLYVGAAKVTKE